MPNVGSIVSIINQSLLAGNFAARNFQTGDFNLIAEPIKTESERGDSVCPNSIDNNGDAHELVYDDRFPFRIFHLKDGWEYSQAPDDDNFGNAGDIMRETANMKLVFVGSRKAMK